MLDRKLPERQKEVLKNILGIDDDVKIGQAIEALSSMSKFENPSPILQKPKVSLFKPLHYPECYNAFLKQNQVMWLPEEQPMADDVKDWQALPEYLKTIIINILRFFVQSDVEVKAGYGKFLECFNYVDQEMMMLAFSNIEGIHIGAYAHLIDTLGLPDSEYSVFMEYKEMRDKYEYYNSVKIECVRDLIKAMAIFSCFTEGMQLFSSFAILYFPSRCGVLKGIAQIISWSIRDEMHHFNSMTALLNKVISENKHLYDDQLKEEIRDIAKEMVRQEDCFINLAMEGGDIKSPNPDIDYTLTKENLHSYARFLCDRRCESIGLEPIYGIKVNPLPYMDEILSQEHANFFETESTDYSKASTRGSWADVDTELDAAFG